MADITPGGVTPAPSVDLSKIENELASIKNLIKGNDKIIIKELAMKLYANTDFNMAGKQTPKQIARDCISRAKALVKELERQEII